jgi:DNA-binding XRE family transcriptional regulator
MIRSQVDMPVRRGRGRPPSPLTALRRHEALRLRREGATAAEIGRQLGISKQGVFQILQRGTRDGKVPAYVLCLSCRGLVSKNPRLIGNHRAGVLCPACLAKRPDAPFAVRLRAVRVAAGLSAAQLAKRSGIRSKTVGEYERGRRRPASFMLAKLVRVLGPTLAKRAEVRDQRVF